MTAHTLDAKYPCPSGWRARCECGHVARGLWEDAALEAHARHLTDETSAPRRVGDVLGEWAAANVPADRAP
jgi:hypothetical protein